MNRTSFDHEEESVLIRRATGGESDALETLILLQQPLILSLAGRLRCLQVTKEELVQAGNIGFIQALWHYDPENGAKLSTYAYLWILGEMQRVLRSAEANRISLDESDEGKRSLLDTLAGNGGIDVGRMDLKRSIQSLTREEQILIILRYYRDKTQKETAHILGKSQAQVSRIERRALDALHAMLAD